jgi:hypothetical protein
MTGTKSSRYSSGISAEGNICISSAMFLVSLTMARMSPLPSFSRRCWSWAFSSGSVARMLSAS